MASREGSGEASREGSEVGSDNEEETTRSVVSLDDNVELLGEKRGSTRESALSAIIKEMKLNYQIAFAEKSRLSLVDAFKRGIKKGSPKEQVLSAKASGILCLTLGADAEDIYKELSPTFQEVISNTTHEEVRCATMEAFSILIFVANDDEKATINLLEIIANIFNSTESKPSEQVAAMKAWALLTTTVNSNFVYSILLPRHLNTFVTFLHSDDVEVRVQAGECIALLFEIARTEESDEFNLSDIGAYASVDMEELLDLLYDLSQDKTKQRAKKDKLKQKVPFKDVVGTVELGESPVETLSFKFQKFDFDSWVKIIQLNAIRDALGQGLSVHFENNNLLQEIFNIHLNREAKKTVLSQTEKRLIYSPSSPLSKARTKNLNKMRTNRSQVTEILEGDDE